MKKLVNLRLILYVLPTPLISKLPLELIKNKSDSITFQIQTRATRFMLWHKKSKEEETGRGQCNWDKKQTDSGSRKTSSGAR